MIAPGQIIHRFLNHGGTLWTNARKSDWPIYEEAIRRYPGPERIVLAVLRQVRSEHEEGQKA